MRPSVVKVTAAHLARGRPNSYTYGPIAHAIRDRCHPGVLAQLVHGELFLCLCGRRWWLFLPVRAREFTARFNAKLPCDPFSFRMDLPAELLRQRSSAPSRRTPEIATVSHGRDRRRSARDRHAG